MCVFCFDDKRNCRPWLKVDVVAGDVRASSGGKWNGERAILAIPKCLQEESMVGKARWKMEPWASWIEVSLEGKRMGPVLVKMTPATLVLDVTGGIQMIPF